MSNPLIRIMPGLWHRGLKVIVNPCECGFWRQIFSFAVGADALPYSCMYECFIMLQGHPESQEYEFTLHNQDDLDRMIEYIRYPEAPVCVR